MPMKYAFAPFVLCFASVTAFAQEPGDPPIKLTPPAIEENAPRPDSPPKKTSRPEARLKLQPKAIEEQESEIEAPLLPSRPTRVEIERSDVEPVGARKETVPTRPLLQLKPSEEDEIQIEVPKQPRRRTRVEMDRSELETAGAEQLPKSLDVLKAEPLPSPPSPESLEGSANAPVPGGALTPAPVYRPLYLDLQTINYSIPGAGALFGHADLVRGKWADGYMFQHRVGPDSAIQVDGAFRGYFRDDQRLKWSGVESTFGGEGVLRPSFVSRTGDWIVSTQGEFFLNMPYGTSFLSDKDRDLYRTNFDVEPFQVFQMFVEARYDDMSVRLGRSRTPFGRYQSPMFTNSMHDAPFIRTEVIGFVETGMFFRYAPDPFVIDFAIVNGEPNLDTNSSKAVVTRWGVEEQTWTAGISAKIQDGIGSEYLKRYNNAFGIDGSVSLGSFLIYGEAVMDQHGFLRDAENHASYDPKKLGIRSLYGRDVFKGDDKPINGRGAYLGVSYRADDWLVDLSCGRYTPEEIGNTVHDQPTNRMLLKTTYMAAKNLELYLILLAENKRPGPFENARPYAAWFGMQYGF